MISVGESALATPATAAELFSSTFTTIPAGVTVTLVTGTPNSVATICL